MVTAVKEIKGQEDVAEQKPQDNHSSELVLVNATSKAGEVKSPKNEKIQNGENGTNGQFAVGSAAKRDYDLVPPDGKWGWFVLAGALASNFLISGSIKSSGVLLVEFREMFDASPSESSAMVALCYFFYSCLAPVTSILSGRWSYRTLVLLGASLGSIGMILSSLATSIRYLFVSFGVLLGLGAGFSVPCAIYIVPTYFVRFRGLANGICISGSVLGSIILPPLTRFLVETYGCRGAVLIQGGIMLNALAAGLLLQPVEKHMVKKYKETKDGDDHSVSEKKDETNKPTILLTSTDEKVDTEKRFTRKPSKERQGIPSNPKNVSSLLQRHRNSLMRRTSEYLKARRISREDTKQNAFSIASTSFCGPKSKNRNETGAHTSNVLKKTTATADSEDKMVTCCFCFKMTEEEKKKHSKQFDIKILKDPIFLIIMVSSCVVPISYTNFMILLPSYVQNIGYSKARGAYLLSTVCTLELVGRLGGSAMCDLKFVPAPVYFAIGLFFAGLTQAIIPFLESYLAISILCALFGLSTGISCGSQTLVMTEVLGLEKLTSSYGVTVFFSGILQLIGPPICGLWFEHDKNFFNMFIFFGIIYIAGAALWLFLPILNRRKNIQAAEATEKA